VICIQRAVSGAALPVVFEDEYLNIDLITRVMRKDDTLCYIRLDVSKVGEEFHTELKVKGDPSQIASLIKKARSDRIGRKLP